MHESRRMDRGDTSTDRYPAIESRAERRLADHLFAERLLA
jgi:hypothetical protein